MRLQRLQLIGLWMCLLIISLPIIHAQSITINTFQGKDGVEDFITTQDELTIEVEASIPGDEEITPDQIHIKYEGSQDYRIFQNCEASTGSTICTTKQEFFNAPNVPIEVVVELHDDFNKFRDFAIPLDEERRTLKPDLIGATIESFTVTPEVSKDGRFTVNFLARDTALAELTGTCSGIKEVMITQDDDQTLTTQPGNKQCSFATSVDVTIDDTDGEYELCALAFDMMGHTIPSELCQKVFKDSEAPKPTQVDIMYEGEFVTILRPGSVIDVLVEISDPSLDRSSVRADFSSLTTNSRFHNVPATEFNGQVVIWRDVPTNGMSECLVKISASDTTGNSVTDEPIGCSVEIDDLGPIVLDFRTNIESDGRFFLGKAGVIVLVIRDDGSGIRQSDIKLDLTQVNALRNVRPDFCEEISEGEFECAWIVRPTRTGVAQVRVESSTTDKAGNALRESATLSINIDSNEPEIGDVEVRIFAAETGDERTDGFAVTADTIVITLTAEGAVRAEGNFSAIGITDIVRGDCASDDTHMECDFSGMVESSGNSGEPIIITFFDEVGNQGIHKEFVRVLGQVDDENPNFWRLANTICTPNAVDNRVTEFINYRVTCAAILKPLAKNAKIVNIELDVNECTEGSEFIADLTLSNTAMGTKTPLLNIQLLTQRYNEPIQFTCPLKITTMIGNRVTAVPEIEDVQVDIGFFTNPLGEASSKLDRKVKKAIDRASGAWDTIGDLKEVLDYAEKTCQVKQQVSNLLLVLDAISTVLDAVGGVIQNIPIIKGLGDALVSIATVIKKVITVIENALKLVWKLVDSLCIFLNCQAASSGDAASLSTLGGGVPWCSNIQSYLNKLIPDMSLGTSTTKTSAGDVDTPSGESGGVTRNEGVKLDQQTTQAINVKESIIWSTVCLCLPGIIHNLEKWHQLQCKYAVCLGNEVRSRGLPVSFCDEQKEYDECAFVFNQIFNAIPFSQIFSDFGAFIENLLTDPVALVKLVLGIICLPECSVDTNNGAVALLCDLCNTVEHISAVADAVISIKSFAENIGDFFEVSDGYCGQMKAMEKEIKMEMATANAPPPAPEPEGIDEIDELTKRIQEVNKDEAEAEFEKEKIESRVVVEQ